MFLFLPSAIPTSVFRDVDSITVYLLPGTRGYTRKVRYTSRYRTLSDDGHKHLNTHFGALLDGVGEQVPIRLLTNYIKQFALEIAGGIFIRFFITFRTDSGRFMVNLIGIEAMGREDGLGRIGRKGLIWSEEH